MHGQFPAAILGLLEAHPAEIAPALVVIIVVAIGLSGPDDLRHGVGQKAILIGALPQAVVGAGQFLGSLEHAQLQIIVRPPQLGHGIAALLVDLRERECVAPHHREKQHGVAEDEERDAGFRTERAVAFAQQCEISQHKRHAQRCGEQLAHQHSA